MLAELFFFFFFLVTLCPEGMLINREVQASPIQSMYFFLLTHVCFENYTADSSLKFYVPQLPYCKMGIILLVLLFPL